MARLEIILVMLPNFSIGNCTKLRAKRTDLNFPSFYSSYPGVSAFHQPTSAEFSPFCPFHNASFERFHDGDLWLSTFELLLLWNRCVWEIQISFLLCANVEDEMNSERRLLILKFINIRKKNLNNDIIIF